MMGAPRYVECKCGHTRTLHPESREEACAADGCRCEEYIPHTFRDGLPTPATAPARLPTDADPLALLRYAKQSTVKRIANLAAKIQDELRDLAQRVADDADTAAMRAEVADLERKLARARAKLRGEQPTPTVVPVAGAIPRPTRGDPVACPSCDYTARNSAGLASHRRSRHAEDGAA